MDAGVAGEQPEVDARRRDARARRHDERHADALDGPDARRRRGDLVVDVEVEDGSRAGHRQTFIARSTRRSATSSALSSRLQLDRLEGEAERRDVLLVDEQLRLVADRSRPGPATSARPPAAARTGAASRSAPRQGCAGSRAGATHRRRGRCGRAAGRRRRAPPAPARRRPPRPGRPRRRSGRPSSRRFDRQAAGVVHLERLGPREGQVEPVGDRLGEGATAEGEHARALDAALADERDVRRAAADVDEQGPRLAQLLAAEHAGDGVRLGDDLEQLEVELAGHALERAEVDERCERVEDADLDVAALEADRVRERRSRRSRRR